MSDPAAQPEVDLSHLYKRDRAVSWFDETPGVIPWPARELLQKYSGIPEKDLEKEVIALRDRAWEIFGYPCIGQFEFLELQLSTRARLYHRLLTRLESGAKFVDIACCLGQDLRKLVFDGAPRHNLAGVELHQEFIDLGYDLFRDRDSLQVEMLRGDILDPTDKQPWPQLAGRFDIVNFGMVLHSFTWEQQVLMLEKGVHVLRENQLGTSIIGLSCGAPDGRIETWAGRKIPSHNADTFRRLVAEVETRTGTRWKVDAEIDNGVSMYDGKRAWVGPDLKRLVFEMTRLA